MVVPIPQLHRDPCAWPEPDKFDPERFLGDNRKSINWTYWQPFGQGPRNCVGMRFALLEIKLAVSHVLTKFRLEPGPRTERGEITRNYKMFLVGPKNGIFVKAVPLLPEQA